MLHRESSLKSRVRSSTGGVRVCGAGAVPFPGHRPDGEVRYQVRPGKSQCKSQAGSEPKTPACGGVGEYPANRARGRSIPFMDLFWRTKIWFYLSFMPFYYLKYGQKTSIALPRLSNICVRLFSGIFPPDNIRFVTAAPCIGVSPGNSAQPYGTLPSPHPPMQNVRNIFHCQLRLTFRRQYVPFAPAVAATKKET